jgi:hypothetical protein
VLHLIFSWSSFLSWVIFVGDLALIAYLTMRAYRDGMCSRGLNKRKNLLTFATQPIHWTDAKYLSLAVLQVAYWTMNDRLLGHSVGVQDTLCIAHLCSLIIHNHNAFEYSDQASAVTEPSRSILVTRPAIPYLDYSLQPN